MGHITEHVSLNGDSGAMSTHSNTWSAAHVQANMKVERSIAWNACVKKRDGVKRRIQLHVAQMKGGEASHQVQASMKVVQARHQVRHITWTLPDR